MSSADAMIRVHDGDDFPEGLQSPDVSFLPGYGQASSLSHGGEWILLEAFDGKWQVPLMVRELPDGMKDAISPYGDLRIIGGTVLLVVKRDGISAAGTQRCRFPPQPQGASVNAPLFIVGAGGFGREVFSIIRALNSSDSFPEISGFIDDDPSATDLKNLEALGSRIVGSIDALVHRTEPFSAVLAVGSAVVREMLAGLLAHSPVTYPVLVHPQATIGCDVHLSEGVVVAAGSRLSTNIRVGRHVQIDQNAAVGHDCEVGDFSRLNPQACISGAVTIGRRTMIGANAIVLQGLKVGDDARVGAGAVVTHSVDPAVTVMGVPAR